MQSDLGLLALLLTFWVFYPGIAFLALMLILVANEQPGRYFSCALLAFVLILQFLAKVPVFEFIVDHPIGILIAVGAYLPVGILYSRFYELPRFCRKVVETYSEAKENFFQRWSPEGNRKNRKDEGMTVEEAWIEDCRYAFPQFQNGTFSIKSYKGKIFTWVAYWPWFLIWRLSYDLLKEIWDAIYLQIQHIYQAVADRIYKDILKDLSQGKK